MQGLFLRSVALVQFYRWYSGEITNSSAFSAVVKVFGCWPGPTTGGTTRSEARVGGKAEVTRTSPNRRF
jgi:hypothetical protein